MAKAVVILFAKAPRLGTVKKRLAHGIGDVAALRFYRNMLKQTLKKLNRLNGCEKILAVSPDCARVKCPFGWRVIKQGHGDLGARMARAFQNFPKRRVVLVGVDIPDLQEADIRAGWRALKHYDAVFGPALDGGYYLAGMSTRRPAKPFANVRWSSPHALVDTARNFSHLRVQKLRMLRDVDTAEDLANMFAQPGH